MRDATQRRVMLDYLDRPRRVVEVAEQIERPVAHASARLGALLRQGVVVRLGHGRYQRSDVLTGNVHAVITLDDRLREFCGVERSLHEIATAMERSPRSLRAVLATLVRERRMEKLRWGGYRVPQRDLFNDEYRSLGDR